jgi:hypothetical protein
MGPRIVTRAIRTLTVMLALVALVVACSSSGGTGSGAATVTGAATATATAAAAPSGTYPNAIAVLGNSGATGFGSDPTQPGADAKQNSWATGDNPAVNSVYLRLLALNPAVRGHNVNVAVAGSRAEELVGQADQALATQPLPGLFLIQTVDNDIRCDGTDASNYAPFAATLAGVLTKLTSAAPKAKILIVSSPWATVQNYGQVAAQLPGPRAANSGTGPCDLFDPSGHPVPARWRTLEAITLHYLGLLKSVCAKFPACQYDNDALYNMPITTGDITSTDGAHLTIAGLRKQAALERRVLGVA